MADDANGQTHDAPEPDKRPVNTRSADPVISDPRLENEDDLGTGEEEDGDGI